MVSSGQIANVDADVVAAMEGWATAFRGEHPEAVAGFYADEAVLWGTLSPVRRAGPSAIQEYFEQLFAFTDRKVTFHDPLVRMYGDISINTGSYTFSWVRDGEGQEIPARYSFTYARRDGRWLIVDHHSSVFPAAP